MHPGELLHGSRSDVESLEVIVRIHAPVRSAGGRRRSPRWRRPRLGEARPGRRRCRAGPRTSSKRPRSARLSPISPPSAAISGTPSLHRSAASARSARAPSTPSLSDTLAPPRTATYGLSGSRRSRPRTSTSRWSAVRRRGPPRCSHQVGQRDDACMRPMRSAERVVHVRVGELGEAPAKRTSFASSPDRSGGSPGGPRHPARCGRTRPRGRRR